MRIALNIVGIFATAALAEAQVVTSPEARLKEAGIELPPTPRAVANYVGAVRSGNLVFLAGQGPIAQGNPLMTGKVGAEISEQEGYRAARLSTLNLLSALRAEVGSLDRVRRIVKVTGWVNSAPGFTRQSFVMNGASDLLVQIFGDAGKHARTSVAANELPLNIPVEIEMVVEVSSDTDKSVAQAALGPAAAQVPGGCNTPAVGRADEVGCYFTAADSLGPAPAHPLFWHLYTYPTRAAAEAATRRARRGITVESLGRVWHFVVADSAWRPQASRDAPAGERVAVLGPLPVPPGQPLTARYMEAVFTPGMRTGVHRHSGPEAWYVLSGAQCLETPEGIIVARAGQGAVVPEGPPMRLSGVGAETRRAVLIVLHHAARPWTSMAQDWVPGGLCPR
jgi:enamine deaminase RidA (YjgF/YER057c/UK114 family)/quercetin dioxygenase-like cupin family protein